MAVNQMKKCITIMMMMLIIMLVVTRVCYATRYIDTSPKDFCTHCINNCLSDCFGGYGVTCTDECEAKNCPCCVKNPPDCAK